MAVDDDNDSDKGTGEEALQADPPKSRFWQGWFRRDDDEIAEGPYGRVRVPTRNEPGPAKRGYILLFQGSIDMWTSHLFRISYGFCFLQFVVVYFVINVLYALILLGVVIAYDNDTNKECLSGWNYDLDASEGKVRKNYEIAFSLAWTTFSTVGYGTISPPQDQGCFGLRFLLSFVAFTGILFSGFCGAVFYSKVSRHHSVAKVTFSNACVIQFGSKGISDQPFLFAGDDEDEDGVFQKFEQGAEDEKIDVSVPNAEDDEIEVSEETDSATLPYPVLDFRVANDKMRIPGNGLFQGSITCELLSVKPSRFLVKAWKGDETLSKTSLVAYGANEPAKLLFTKVKVSPSQIPVLDTVCYLRHVLDENSPLLEPSVKKQIVELGGWPATINDHASIRECISKSAREIVIGFSAMSQLTAEEVYMLHQYKIEDIYVGWRFVGMHRLDKLIESKEFKSREVPTREQVRHHFDMDLIHQIMPQRGGGNEPAERF